MPHTPAGKVFTELVIEVFRLNGRLLSTGDRITRPTGQSSARWQILGALDRPLPVAGIARGMGLARQSVQRTADILEAEGLVEYAENPAHRRAKLVRLTSRGRSVLTAITRRQIVWANRLGAVLGSEKIRQALAVIRQFRQELEKEARGGDAR